MKAALVVVDMQDYFLEHLPEEEAARVIGVVCARIRTARRFKRRIIVVEYEYCGNNNPRIEEALAGYDRIVRVTKDRDDGAEDITRVLSCHNITDISSFRIVGVNYGCCVYSTCCGLRHRGRCAWIDKRASNYSHAIISEQYHKRNVA